jgi:hypothetical protein
LSVRPPAVVLALLCVSRSVSAEPAAFGSAELAAGGGYDSNMFLQVSPDTAAREPRLSGWFAHVEPRLGTALSAGGFRFDLSYALDYRGSEAAGHMALQQVDLAIVLLNIGRLRPTLTGTVGRFDASRFSTDRFLFAGGGLDLRLELTNAFRVTAGYRLEVRTFPGRADEKDLVHLGDLRFGFRPSSQLEFGLGSTYFALAPAHAAVMDDGTIRVLRVGPDTELVSHHLSLGLSAWGGTISVAGVGRDWQVGGGLAALYRITRNLDLACWVDLTFAPWASDLRAQDYTRQYLGLGVVGHVTGKTSIQQHPPEADLRPMVKDGQVRFRAKAPAAASVTVVGSWDDWAGPGTALSATKEPGLWEAWVALPAGTHRYRFMVDGRPARPPDAPRYLPDDFGGEDAVIDVVGGGAP